MKLLTIKHFDVETSTTGLYVYFLRWRLWPPREVTPSPPFWSYRYDDAHGQCGYAWPCDEDAANAETQAMLNTAFAPPPDSVCFVSEGEVYRIRCAALRHTNSRTSRGKC